MNIELLHKEVQYKAVASSGPGGQNVNKVATKVQLYFDVVNSLAFAEAEHERIKPHYKNNSTQKEFYN
jgi:ribosome-associated protein